MWFHVTVLGFLIIIQISGTCTEKVAKRTCSQSLPSQKDDGIVENSFCATKSNRYFLYDVNPGEGFNLRRDIYVRLSPLINKLNREDVENRWILVLPPWGRIPHWKNTERDKYYSWKTYFDVEKIQEFVTAIEFDEFLEEYGLDNNLDIVFQLQHFPFDNQMTDWREKIEVKVNCQERLKYQLNKNSGLYKGHFWGSGILAKKAECMALRGQASTLLDFLLKSNYKSVMFDRAEVILWDSYGQGEWWQARKSLQFSKKLIQKAKDFLVQKLSSLDRNDPTGSNLFIAMHLRRKDFLFGRKEQFPSVLGAAIHIFTKMKQLKIYSLFVATDNPEECEELFGHLNDLAQEVNLPNSLIYMKFSDNDHDLTEGEFAVIDQIICSWATYFIGTRESTFTLRIFEEREILGMDENSTFNYFCPDNVSAANPCKEPTRWKMKV